MPVTGDRLIFTEHNPAKQRTDKTFLMSFADLNENTDITVIKPMLHMVTR